MTIINSNDNNVNNIANNDNNSIAKTALFLRGRRSNP